MAWRGQSQFSAYVSLLETKNRPDISELQAWILGHPGGDDLSVPAFADRMAMSPRNFSRLVRDVLMRSLQRALHRDGAGRRITEPDAGPLFKGMPDPQGTESGTIYVLRSLSDHPDIVAYRDVIHKIGVTGGDVE